jgi:hypothetical protein
MSWTFSITKEVGESASPMSLREAVTDEGDFEANARADRPEVVILDLIDRNQRR